MIYTPRSGNTDHTCTKINFRGFEISIAMDDRSLGGNRPLTRTTLAVFKDENDVTAELPGITNVTEYGIRECDAEDLYKVMQAIAALPNETSTAESYDFVQVLGDFKSSIQKT